MLLVSLGEGQYTDIMTYGAIIKGIYKQLQRESELKDKGKFFSLWEITDHWNIKVGSSSYEVLVNWENDNANWEPVSVMRRDEPIYLFKYAK